MVIEAQESQIVFNCVRGIPIQVMNLSSSRLANATLHMGLEHHVIFDAAGSDPFRLLCHVQ